MVKVADINKNTWEIVKLGDYWRFVDHANKLLTVGWKIQSKLDISLIRIDSITIPEMLDRYKDYY